MWPQSSIWGEYQFFVRTALILGGYQIFGYLLISLHNVLHLIELSVKSPSVSPRISSAFAPYPLFQSYLQSKEILLNLSVKCWNSAFNAHRSRVIIVVVQGGAEKIYVAAVAGAQEKETHDETQFTTKLGGKTSLGPSYFLLQNFHSQLLVWCPIMPKLAVLAPPIA